MAALDLVCPLEATSVLNEEKYDSVLLITDSVSKLTGPLEIFKAAIENVLKIDSRADQDISVIRLDEHPSKRCIFSPTGPLNRDYDDVRRFSDAAAKGIKRCLKAGSHSPLLVRVPDDSFPNADLVTILGALHAAYVPIELRERAGSKKSKLEKMGVWGTNVDKVNKLIKISRAIESGRIVTRDIGGSDPERMAAPQVAAYLENNFSGSKIRVDVTSSPDLIDREYPLLGAVNRCAKMVPRHEGRVIALKYEGEGKVDTTLMLVGKGVTFDTGGVDVKAGGIMAGMHRDKCGAAAVAGFFQVLNVLQPKGINVTGALAMVRNSIGSNAYVADELITARSGVVVRVGNTDAEGRMAMADLLCQMKEMAQEEVNPHLFTIATLTGHVCLSYGEEYTAVIDNGPAKRETFSQKLQAIGDALADPFEISTLRREDYNFIVGKSEYEDVIQCNNQPSSRTPRGHQFPAAFLARVSGLDKHGIDSNKPIKYSHLDIAGSSGPFPGVPTGAPVVALTGYYILPRL